MITNFQILIQEFKITQFNKKNLVVYQKVELFIRK
jgi:hypothetical protein